MVNKSISQPSQAKMILDSLQFNALPIPLQHHIRHLLRNDNFVAAKELYDSASDWLFHSNDDE